MIEALIASALVLVPLFLAIPVIAKYLDIRSHVVQSARYAAWERTVWFGGDAARSMGLGATSSDPDSPFNNKWDANEKEDSAIRGEISTRILSDNTGTNGFTDADRSGTGTQISVKNFWQDRKGTPLASYGDVSGKFSGLDSAGKEINSDAPGVFNKLFGPVMDVASVISNFTVDTHGQYTAKVGLSVQRVAFNPDAGLGGCPSCDPGKDFLAAGTPQVFSETNVLVTNGWSANGPGSLTDYGAHPKKTTVYNQIRGLTPTSLINPPDGAFRTALDVLQTIALIFFPELSTLDLGRIEVDKVPADRLR